MKKASEMTADEQFEELRGLLLAQGERLQKQEELILAQREAFDGLVKLMKKEMPWLRSRAELREHKREEDARTEAIREELRSRAQIVGEEPGSQD